MEIFLNTHQPTAVDLLFATFSHWSQTPVRESDTFLCKSLRKPHSLLVRFPDPLSAHLQPTTFLAVGEPDQLLPSCCYCCIQNSFLSRDKQAAAAARLYFQAFLQEGIMDMGTWNLSSICSYACCVDLVLLRNIPVWKLAEGRKLWFALAAATVTAT